MEADSPPKHGEEGETFLGPLVLGSHRSLSENAVSDCRTDVQYMDLCSLKCTGDVNEEERENTRFRRKLEALAMQGARS